MDRARCGDRADTQSLRVERGHLESQSYSLEQGRIIVAIRQCSNSEMARCAAEAEGVFLGISSGASLAAVRQKLPDLPAGSRILTFGYDTGERYLSVDGLF